MVDEQATHLKILHRQDASPLQLAAQSFLLSREAMHCTEATLVWYKKYIGALVDYLTAHGVQDVKSIAPDHLRAFLVSLQRRGLADRTVHHHASAARAFCHFLVSEGMLPASPMNKVKMPRLPKSILPAFAPEDVRRLLAVCETPRDTAIVLCLLDTGLRAGEFVALNVGDMDVKTGAVQVRRGKGGKGRVAFLGAKARKALLRYIMARGEVKADDPLWLSCNTGERLTHHGLRLLLRRLGKRAGVEHCTPHTFRRTFALWSLRAGMNVYALQQIMGHSDLTILRRYLALVEQDLEEAHRKHGAVDNML